MNVKDEDNVNYPYESLKIMNKLKEMKNFFENEGENRYPIYNYSFWSFIEEKEEEKELRKQVKDIKKKVRDIFDILNETIDKLIDAEFDLILNFEINFPSSSDDEN